MIGSIGKRGRGANPADILAAFVQSWNMHVKDETAIGSGSLDILRAYLGDRPCCVWKRLGAGLQKVSERGMLEMRLNALDDRQQRALERVVVSGASEFEAAELESFSPQYRSAFDGVLHVPLKVQENLWGVISLGASKKEARDRAFVQALEGLGRLMAIAFQNAADQADKETRERRLRAELSATGRELAQTNRRLIERVKDLKSMSKELERRIEELTHANRAKDEFLSVVSHELRTPLTSLKGFLCVLLDGDAGPINDAQTRFLSIAKQSADRLNVLISDLLDISRIESGRLNLEMRECSLLEIISESLQGLRSAAEAKQIKVGYQETPALPLVWCDPSRLQQVVDNIVSNAIKYTPHGGTVEVVTCDKGDVVQVSVRDNGPGIDAEEQKKIFDMFYQVDASARRTTGGAGLGLAIANGIVSMHGGKLWVDSEKDHGTTFTFAIPRHKGRNAA